MLLNEPLDETKVHDGFRDAAALKVLKPNLLFFALVEPDQQFFETQYCVRCNLHAFNNMVGESVMQPASVNKTAELLAERLKQAEDDAHDLRFVASDGVDISVTELESDGRQHAHAHTHNTHTHTTHARTHARTHAHAHAQHTHRDNTRTTHTHTHTHTHTRTHARTRTRTTHTH